MDISRKPNGKWELRWREGGQRRSRTFDRKGDATAFEADRIRRKQLGHAAVPDDVPLREFVETYWALHAKPNLAESTRDFYARTSKPTPGLEPGTPSLRVKVRGVTSVHG